MLNEIDHHDFKVLFISQPYFRYEKKIKAAERAEWVKDYIKDRGYEFLDLYEYREEIGIDPQKDYSLDYNHYHLESAEKITHFLGEFLVSHYDLEDKSPKPEYSDWNDDYEEWENVIYKEEAEKVKNWRSAYLEENK